MRFVVSILSLMVFATCSTRLNSERPIFSVSADQKFAVAGYQETKDGVIWIADTSDYHEPPVFQLTDQWNLAGYNRIKIILINGNQGGNINATVKMESTDPIGAYGSLESKKTLRGGDTVEWIILLPPAPQNPEVLGRLTGMRATPFSIDGVTSTINGENVTGISVSFDKSLKDARLGIKEISALKGPAIESQQWFAMPPAEFFPFIDQYGQFVHKDWPGKTEHDSDLTADRVRELEVMESNPGPNDRSQYGGWLTGKKLEATGNFYVHKVDGKWWMVDPDGYQFWSHGVVRVTPSSAVTLIHDREHYFASLPDTGSPFSEFYETRDEFMYQYYKSWDNNQTFDFSSANLRRKYGEDWRARYREMIYKRLRNWGMNTLSAGSDKAIYRQAQIPYCDRIELATPRIAGAPDRLNVIRDPFHPLFSEQLTEQLLERKEELQSKWCYGYFIDNKLVWGADHDLGRWVLKSSDSQPAKIAFLEKLQNKYRAIGNLNSAWKSAYRNWDELLVSQEEPPENSRTDCAEFSSILIDKYFSSVAHVMKQVAPGKLYLGCRYVTVNKKVLEIAANYCDVLTFDLFIDTLADFSLPAGVDKPVLIGEFHFGALDRGLFHPGLNQKANQKERGLAYEKYVRSALLNPSIIGTAWHQFSDQATTGRFDGENFQDGLTDVCDKVYIETVNKVRQVGAELYRIRGGLENN